MKAHLLSYYNQSLCQAYDPGVTRLFKPICTSCIMLANGQGTKTAAIKLHMNCYCNFYVVSHRTEHEPVRREGNSKERVKKGFQMNFISTNGALHKAYCSVQSTTLEK